VDEALQFALQYEWHVKESKQPLGYHKVHKRVTDQQLMEDIVNWCSEISLAKAGTLESFDRSGEGKEGDA
jgi:hypothetical protein